MSLVQIVDVVFRRQRTIFAGVLAGTIVAVVALTLALPKVYEATSTLVVGENRLVAEGGSLVERDELLARTYGALLDKPATLERVVRALPFRMSRGDLERSVSFEVVAGTQLVDITASDDDPRRAQEIASVYARTFVSFQRDSVRTAGRQTLETLNERIGDLAQSVRRLEDRSSGSAEAAGELEQARSELEAVRDSYRSAQENIALQASNISIASLPSTPSDPARPRPKLYIALGVILALILATVAALVRDVFDKRIRSEEELAELLAAPILTRVPMQSGSAGERLHQEAFQFLRSNVQLQDPGRERALIAVTSALPGDGKSLVSSRLAGALALSGENVVVVDCDLRQPTQHVVFQTQNSQGVSNVLVGSRAAADLLKPTPHPNVRLLPAGPAPPNPAVLLGTGRCREMLAELRDDADYVIVDTPPVTIGADTSAVAAAVDGVILVVDLQRLSRDSLISARDQLRNSGTPILGLVLNRTAEALAEYGDYYGPRRDERDIRTARRPTVPESRSGGSIQRL